MKLSNNLTFESIIQSFERKYGRQYNSMQLSYLRKGFDKGLDISRCANPRYDWTLIKEMLYGLMYGVDISRHIDYDTTEERARLIREGRVRKLDVSRYESRKLTQKEAKKIYEGLLEEKLLQERRKRMTKVQLENETNKQLNNQFSYASLRRSGF